MRHSGDTNAAIETEPSPEDIRRLEEQIHAFNVQATGISDGKLLALFLREADGATVGGVFGWTWGDSCYVRYLFIPEPLRGEGHGTRLMQAGAANKPEWLDEVSRLLNEVRSAWLSLPAQYR